MCLTQPEKRITQPSYTKPNTHPQTTPTPQAQARGAIPVLLQKLVSTITLRNGQVDIDLSKAAVLEAIGVVPTEEQDEPIRLTAPAVRMRHGHELRLVIPGTDQPRQRVSQRNEKLVELIVEANAARELILSKPDQSMNRIAADANRCRTRLARLFGLSFPAPDIVKSILDGRQPEQLRPKMLLETELPMAWPEQRAALGFA